MTLEITREILIAYILERKIEQEIFTMTGIVDKELNSKIEAAKQLYERMGFAEKDRIRKERKSRTAKYRRIV